MIFEFLAPIQLGWYIRVVQIYGSDPPMFVVAQEQPPVDPDIILYRTRDHTLAVQAALAAREIQILSHQLTR